MAKSGDSRGPPAGEPKSHPPSVGHPQHTPHGRILGKSMSRMCPFTSCCKQAELMNREAQGSLSRPQHDLRPDRASCKHA